MRYAAQAFLDGFTSATSIFSPAVRPGSDEPLFLSNSPSEALATVDQTIMADVENFLREVEPLILNNQVAHSDSQVLLMKIMKNKNILSPSQSGT